MDTPKTQTAPISLPVAPVVNAYEVEVRNPREFRPEGQATIYYSADAEMATPGERWATLRLRVSSKTGPVPTGKQKVVLDSYDLKRGEGVCHVV